MKTIRIIAALVAAAAILAVGIGALVPSRWSVRQDIEINAPLLVVRPYFDSLKRWQEWLPSSKDLDPKARQNMTGPQEGPGNSRSWLGTELGRGKVTIAESNATTLVLDEEIESEVVNAKSTLTFTETARGTQVTWSDQGALPKPFGGYFKSDVETQLNDYFGRGLAKVKSLAEAAHNQQLAILKAQEIKALETLDAGTPTVDAGSVTH